MLALSEVVATARAVATTRSRRAKAAMVADLLRRADPHEAGLAAGFLMGEVRQGRVGVGGATLRRLDVAPAAEATLDVADVDATFEALRTRAGPGADGRRDRALVELWSRATPAEQEFLGRLFLGELRQGALEGVMLDAIAVATGIDGSLVRRAAMVAGDVATVATAALGGGAVALSELRLEVGRGLLPMLASPAADVGQALARAGGVASVEWKLDGMRIQVHRRPGQVRVFSRSLHDVTERFAGVVEVARSLPVDHVVLDGEALLVDDAGRPHAFQDSMSRLGTTPGPEPGPDPEPVGATVTPFFFDVVHRDGVDLLDRPLDERQAHLDEVVPGRWRAPRLVTADRAEAEAFLAATVAAGHEGVVVKARSSTYEAGRRGSQWSKVKPVHTLDLVVLAAEWGHGRRRGWLSNLHLGARDPSSGSFAMVGKTFKGLTDEVLGWQTQRLLELEQARDGITVHVRPELVVEVAVDGVQRSTRYPAGVALRFARVRRYRPDKAPTEADAVAAVRALLAPVAG